MGWVDGMQFDVLLLFVFDDEQVLWYVYEVGDVCCDGFDLFGVDCYGVDW